MGSGVPAFVAHYCLKGHPQSGQLGTPKIRPVDSVERDPLTIEPTWGILFPIALTMLQIAFTSRPPDSTGLNPLKVPATGRF
jgi:hypothetical protein